jgi:hypothetical protein
MKSNRKAMFDFLKRIYSPGAKKGAVERHETKPASISVPRYLPITPSALQHLGARFNI